MKLKTVAKVIGGGAFAAVTYFTAGEFSSPDQPDSGYKMDSTFIARLDSARGIAGIPFKINSGYRSEHRNRLVGGVKNSAHTKGLAADIKVESGSERYIITKALMDVGFTRLGIANGFIHVDSDTTKPAEVIWLY